MGKPQIIKFEQNLCNASVNDNSVLFVRVGDIVTDKKAQVEVPFTHTAYIIKGGSDARIYDSGHYQVFDDRKEVKDWKKGFSVDVIYMPKDTDVVILWGTPQRFQYRDAASNKVVNVGARGQFGVHISNPEQFFRKVVGVRTEFDLEDFKKRFSAEVVNEFADCFLKVVGEKKLTYDLFAAHKKDIALEIGRILSEKFTKTWGISLNEFIIEYVGITEQDSEAVEAFAAEEHRQRKIKEYLAEVERLDDKNWEREKYLRQLELEDKQAYYDVLKIIGHAPVSGSVGAVGGGFCPKCGKSCPSGAAFCPNCGGKISADGTVCRDCGRRNEAGAAFCVGCGKKL